MLKGLLCLIIIVFSALAGWSKASVYSERVAQLQNLTRNLKYLESEMGYRMEPVPVVLNRIGESRAESGGAFFMETVRLLSSGEESSLYEAWERALDKVYPDEVISTEDKKIIKSLGYELGRTDMESQHKLFSHCFTELAEQTEAAGKEALVKGKMYRGLGVSVGILAAVLFL